MDPLPHDETLRLRWPRADDAESIYAYAHDPDQEQTYWLPIAFQPSREVVRQFVEELGKGWSGREGLAVIVAAPTSDTLIGLLTFSRWSEVDVAEVTYGVAPASRNRGVATHALELVAPWAFANLGLRRLELHINATHIVSQRVAAKAGFTRQSVVHARVPATGEEYDDIIYALDA